MKINAALVILPLLILVLSACTGVHSFSHSVRAGDTVALATGYRHTLSRDTMTVEITPVSGFRPTSVETGPPVIYPPNDPNVLAIVNLYPDPVSSLLVSREINTDLSPNARVYEQGIENLVTSDNKDMWETMVYLNVPDLPVGLAKVEITDISGESIPIMRLNIVADGGSQHPFETLEVGNLNAAMRHSMERVPNNPIVFGGSTVPHAIDVTLSHDGSGQPIAINPRGDIKSLAWSDNGSSLRVIMMPSGAQTRDHINDFRFYVAGGASNVQIASIAAFDINGNPVNDVIGTVLPAPAPVITSVITSGSDVIIGGANLCVLCPAGGAPNSTDSSVSVDNSTGGAQGMLTFVSETQLIFELPVDGYTTVYLDTLGGSTSFTP